MLAITVDERVASVAIEVIHDKVDGLRCRGGEVPPGLWLHGAKDVRGAAPLVLIVLFGWLPRLGWDRRAHIGVQRYRFFVQADDRLGCIVGPS